MKHKDSLFLTTNIATESNMIDYVSKEYNAMDWTRFFFGQINQLVRWINKGSVQVKINGLEAFVDYFLGNASKIGVVLNTLSDIQAIAAGPLGLIANGLKYYNQIAKSGENGYFKGKVDSLPNIYMMLYNNTNNIDWYKPEVYKEVLKANKEVMEELKKAATLPMWREAYTGELNQLKLLRPRELEKDIANLSNTMQRRVSDPSLIKQWETIINEANTFSRNLMSFILDHVRDGNNYIKKY